MYSPTADRFNRLEQAVDSIRSSRGDLGGASDSRRSCSRSGSCRMRGRLTRLRALLPPTRISVARESWTRWIRVRRLPSDRRALRRCERSALACMLSLAEPAASESAVHHR